MQDRSRSPTRGGYSEERRYEDRRDRRDSRGGRDGRDFRGRSSGGFRRQQRDFYPAPPQHDRNYSNSVFVGNLPFTLQWQQLKDHFAGAGRILHADIISQRGRSKGMGTVEFADRETAERAIQMFDRTEFAGREIFVREDLPPPEKQQQQPQYREDRYADRPPRRERQQQAPQEGHEIFVGNLPYSMRWQDLKDMFRPFGDIVRADIKEGPGHRSKGCGTVVYSELQAAEEAINQMNGHEVMSRRLEVRHGRFQPGYEQSQPRNKPNGLSLNSELTLGVNAEGPNSNVIFVGNLPWETAQSDLFDLFGSITSVKRAELQYARNGRPSGNAVVELESEDAAQQVINQLNNYQYGNRPLKISFAKYPSEEELNALNAEIELSKQNEKLPSGPAATTSAVNDVQMDAEQPLPTQTESTEQQPQQAVVEEEAPSMDIAAPEEDAEMIEE